MKQAFHAAQLFCQWHCWQATRTEIVVGAALRKIFVISSSPFFLYLFTMRKPTKIRPSFLSSLLSLCSAAICFSSSLSKRGKSSAVTWAAKRETRRGICAHSRSLSRFHIPRVHPHSSGCMAALLETNHEEIWFFRLPLSSIHFHRSSPVQIVP